MLRAAGVAFADGGFRPRVGASPRALTPRSRRLPGLAVESRAVTIASLLVIGVLLVSEFLYYQQTHVREVLRVDTELGGGKLDISFHFTFPRLQCECATPRPAAARGHALNRECARPRWPRQT